MPQKQQNNSCSAAMCLRPAVMRLGSLVDLFRVGRVSKTVIIETILPYPLNLSVIKLLSFMWPIWVLAGVVIGAKVALKLYKNYRLAQSGIMELNHLDGLDFEKYLEGLFRKLGYTVKRTAYQGDYGADLIIEKAGVQTVVQAKRYNRSVGVKAIQEVVAAKNYYRCQQAMVVTNRYYSQAAKKLAQANQVHLWDRDDLVNRLLSTKQQTADEEMITDTVPLAQAVLNRDPTSQANTSACCAICGVSVGVRADFWTLKKHGIVNRKGGRNEQTQESLHTRI